MPKSDARKWNGTEATNQPTDADQIPVSQLDGTAEWVDLSTVTGDAVVKTPTTLDQNLITSDGTNTPLVIRHAPADPDGQTTSLTEWRNANGDSTVEVHGAGSASNPWGIELHGDNLGVNSIGVHAHDFSNGSTAFKSDAPTSFHAVAPSSVTSVGLDAQATKYAVHAKLISGAGSPSALNRAAVNAEAAGGPSLKAKSTALPSGYATLEAHLGAGQTEPVMVTKDSSGTIIDTIIDADGHLVAPGGGGVGTVTSVALTVPSEFSVSGSPITSSGTLAVSKATQAANKVFAGPTSGSAAQPTFRSLVSDDIPNNAADTTGTAANITGTAAIAHGGTGQTTAAAAFAALSPTTTKGDLIVDDGTNPVRLAVGANGKVLTSDSSVTEGVKWADAASGPAVTAYVARWQVATIGATLFTGVGAAAPSISTDFGNNPASDSSGTYLAEETGTTNGNRYVISWGGTSALCRHDQLPDVSVATKTGPSASDVTGLRMWPLFLGPSNPYNVDTSNHGCGFRFSPAVAGDTQFVAFSKDGTTAQTTATGITPAAATVYVFRMVVGASDINFYINGTLVATHSTNVPAASTEHVFRTTLTTETGSTTRRLWVKSAYITHA